MLVLVTTPGIHFLVSWGGGPANIPPAEIEAVRRLVESSLKVESHPFLKCGDRVRIKSGPLEGIEGILVRKTLGFRLVLSVEMLSKSAAVEVDLEIVERLPHAQPTRGNTRRNGLSPSHAVPNLPYAFVAG